jgi:UrcA family protein
MSKALFILVAAAALAVPAAAAEPVVARAPSAEPTISRNVHFADLNLESDGGRAELQRRLNRAVSAICSVDSVAPSAALSAEEARCMTETAAGLDAQVDAAVRANRARTARVASN